MNAIKVLCLNPFSNDKLAVRMKAICEKAICEESYFDNGGCGVLRQVLSKVSDVGGHRRSQKYDSDADKDIHDLSAYNGFACHFI